MQGGGYISHYEFTPILTVSSTSTTTKLIIYLYFVLISGYFIELGKLIEHLFHEHFENYFGQYKTNEFLYWAIIARLSAFYHSLLSQSVSVSILKYYVLLLTLGPTPVDPLALLDVPSCLC